MMFKKRYIIGIFVLILLLLAFSYSYYVFKYALEVFYENK